MSSSRLERASEHVWWFTPAEQTDRPALALVAGREATLLLDVGASRPHTLGVLGAATSLALPPLGAAVLTHWHWDHSFGGAALEVPIIAQTETAHEVAHQAALDWADEALAARVRDGSEIAFCEEMIRLEMPDRSALRIVRPQLVFENRLEIPLGGVTCLIEHVGGDHAADSSVIYVVEDELLFLGDCLYERLYAPEPMLTIETSRALVRRIAAYGARLAIEGHDDALLDAARLGRRLDQLTAAAARVEKDGRGALSSAKDLEERQFLEAFLAGLPAA